MSDISINMNADGEEFQGVYQYPEWYNKKKFIFYNKILARLKKLHYLHTRASQHFDKMNYYILGPSITITAISGIASFLSTSQFVGEGTQNAFGIGVGIVASISSVLQALAGACQFSAKKESHRVAAEQYNNLIVKTKFEIEMPNEEDYADKLEIEILDIGNKCNYFVPQFIIDDYEKKKNKSRENDLLVFKKNELDINRDDISHGNPTIISNKLKSKSPVSNSNSNSNIKIKISETDTDTNDNNTNNTNDTNVIETGMITIDIPGTITDI